MGIDIDGRMIVGASGSDVYNAVDVDDYLEWAEEECLCVCPAFYDAGFERSMVGFEVKAIDPNDPEFLDWLANVVALSKDFKELTGLDAMLMGTQDVN